MARARRDRSSDGVVVAASRRVRVGGAAVLLLGTVIATTRAVTDAGAAELGARFYQAGGLADPIRALAAAQAALAETPDTDWPQFTIFGSERCLSTR